MKVVRIILGLDVIIVLWILFLVSVLRNTEEIISGSDKNRNSKNVGVTDRSKRKVPALDVPPPVVEITPEATEDETPRINEVLAQSDVGGGKDQNNHEAQLNNDWEDHVCDTVEDSICHEAFVVADMKVTFCSAAKVASTTTKTYFYKLSKDLVIPDDAQFGVHEANWIRLHMVDNEARRHILKADDWTHVFFWKRVLERFISGYLDKVVHDCETHTRIGPHLAIHHYIQYGFSCEQHTDLEAFVSFMETVPSFEGHFHAQASLCSLGRYPVSEMVCADETLSDSLKGLSASLGVEHPLEEKKSSTHSTKAKEKMVALFKDKPFLIQRILDMFKEDCEIIPGACNVDELMTGIEAATKVVE